MTVNTDKILSSRWWYALAAMCVACYLLAVSWLTDNTPKFDDMNDVFGFFKQLALAQTPLQKVGAFFYPNNEHITAFSHLIYFLQYQWLGEINFYWLTLMGHLIIIATGCLLGCVVNNAQRPFYFAVFVIGYVNLYYWDSSFKAMTAISNQAVILFALATFFILVRAKNFIFALCLAVLASFSQGNGVLVWPIGVLIMLLDKQWPQYRFTRITLWLLVAAGIASLCVWARSHYGASSPVTLSLVIEQWQQYPALPVISLLAFIGSTVFSTAHGALAIMVGTDILLISTLLLWHCRDKNRLSAAILLFLLTSAASAAIMRSLVGGGEGMLESRYKMYSLALALLTGILCCEYWLAPRSRRWAATLLLLAALGIQISSYRVIPAIQHQAQAFRESYQYWLEDGDFKRQAVYFIPMSDHFLFVAEHLHLFDFMQFAPDAAIVAPLSAVSGRTCPPTPAPADHCPMTIRHRGNAITVVVDIDTNQPALPANIILCDEQANAVMEFVLPEHSTSQQHWLIPEADIPAGNYRVLFQPAQQPACETQLTKKPRKVKTEMRTLFGGE